MNLRNMAHVLQLLPLRAQVDTYLIQAYQSYSRIVGDHLQEKAHAGGGNR